MKRGISPTWSRWSSTVKICVSIFSLPTPKYIVDLFQTYNCQQQIEVKGSVHDLFTIWQTLSQTYGEEAHVNVWKWIPNTYLPTTYRRQRHFKSTTPSLVNAKYHTVLFILSHNIGQLVFLVLRNMDWFYFYSFNTAYSFLGNGVDFAGTTTSSPGQGKNKQL